MHYSSNKNFKVVDAHKWHIRIHKIPQAFIPKSFTDVFENKLFSVFTNHSIKPLYRVYN